MANESVMNVLFVPHPMPSHLIPLVALARHIASEGDITHAFLLPKELHEFAAHLGVRVLKIDRRLEEGVRAETMALEMFRPHIIVDDLSPTTAFFVRLASLPRVCLIRKGLFPGETSQAGYRHSSDILQHFTAMKAMGLRAQNFWEPEELSDLFVGDINLIPSSSEIEVLPSTLRDSDRYRYVGPLLLEDDEMIANLRYLNMGAVSSNADLRRFTSLAPKRDFGAISGDLAQFLQRSGGRPIVYFNIGLAYPQELYEKRGALIQAMLDTGASVISNVDTPSLAARDRFFAAPFLPMHLVCSKADLMVHQCGSGTYNYQLMHECPAIILGSNCADRDSVGARLDEIGAATYIPAAEAAADGLTRFKQALCALLDIDSNARQMQIQQLSRLRLSLLRTRQAFNFKDELREALRKHRAVRTGREKARSERRGYH